MNSHSQRKSLESIETYLANLPVVTLRGFLEEVLVLGHLLLVREGDTVDTLQRVVLGVAEEVRRRALAEVSSIPVFTCGDMKANKPW